jgi:hypothetical protein
VLDDVFLWNGERLRAMSTAHRGQDPSQPLGRSHPPSYVFSASDACPRRGPFDGVAAAAIRGMALVRGRAPGHYEVALHLSNGAVVEQSLRGWCEPSADGRAAPQAAAAGHEDEDGCEADRGESDESSDTERAGLAVRRQRALKTHRLGDLQQAIQGGLSSASAARVHGAYTCRPLGASQTF